MTYALVRNGKVVSVGLPNIGALPDGRKVSNFDKLDRDTLREIGWLPVEDPGPPEYDPNTTGVGRSLSVDGDRVVVVYSLEDLPPTPEPVPAEATTQEQLDYLMEKLIEKNIFDRSDVSDTRRPRPRTR